MVTTSFQWHAPSTLEDVHNLLAQHGDEARLIAGGTSLVLMMKQRLVQPEHLVSLRRVPGLSSVELRNGHVHIGATVTHRFMETSQQVKERVPILAEAYRHVATVRIREMATVGGGLAHADPAQDSPPALLALDALVRLTSAQGERTVPLSEFFVDFYTTAMKTGEVLTEVLVPVPPPKTGWAFMKFLPRTADDYGVVVVAVSLRVDSRNKCQHVRIALGSAGPTPVRATNAEAVLAGHKVTAGAIQEAAEVVKSEIDPISDVRGSAEYKKEMAAVFTRRALEQALARCR